MPKVTQPEGKEPHIEVFRQGFLAGLESQQSVVEHHCTYGVEYFWNRYRAALRERKEQTDVE